MEDLADLLAISDDDSDKLEDLKKYAKAESVKVGAVLAGLASCGKLDKDTARRLLLLHLSSGTQAVGRAASAEEAAVPVPEVEAAPAAAAAAAGGAAAGGGGVVEPSFEPPDAVPRAHQSASSSRSSGPNSSRAGIGGALDAKSAAAVEAKSARAPYAKPADGAYRRRGGGGKTEDKGPMHDMTKEALARVMAAGGEPLKELQQKQVKWAEDQAAAEARRSGSKVSVGARVSNPSPYGLLI